MGGPTPDFAVHAKPGSLAGSVERVVQTSLRADALTSVPFL